MRTECGHSRCLALCFRSDSEAVQRYTTSLPHTECKISGGLLNGQGMDTALLRCSQRDFKFCCDLSRNEGLTLGLAAITL